MANPILVLTLDSVYSIRPVPNGGGNKVLILILLTGESPHLLLGENYHILDHPLSFIFRISFKKDSYAFTGYSIFLSRLYIQVVRFDIYYYLGPNRREVISWFYDIKTVIKANRNLEAVGGGAYCTLKF
jgi:hypothetical protein